MSTFIDDVRSGKVKQPTQRGFKLETWNSAWDKKTEKTTDCERIYEAGKIFHDFLSETRNDLKILSEKHTPRISNRQYMEMLFATSNRDMYVTHNLATKREMNAKSLLSATFDANPSKSEITLDEIAHGLVDGVSLAISACVSRIEKNIEMVPGEFPKPALEYILDETYLSQKYAMYESYWQAILWRDFSLERLSAEQKAFEVIQHMTQHELAFEVSNNRKLRLASQGALLTSDPKMLSLFEKNKYIQPSGFTKNKTLTIRTLKDSNKILQARNAVQTVSGFFLSDEFPENFLKKDHGQGFNLTEALDVFRNLSLIAAQCCENFPEDDSAFTKDKLLKFTVTFNKQKLNKALREVTKNSATKIEAILNFLTFKNSSQDIWCHPLVEHEKNKLCLLIGAIISPNLARVVECWLENLGIDLGEKGDAYEEKVVALTNEAIDASAVIKDYNKATAKNIKIGENFEQIDFLLRVDNIVIVGESKSIVTTDSPISYFRTLKTLEKAAEQALRKAKFFEENLTTAFKTLEWNFDKSKNYTIVPIIINSSKIYSGFSISNIPVVDHKIICRFFENGEFPILSAGEEGKLKHYAWLHLYKDFEEMVSSLPIYLKHPPQITETASDFISKSIDIPITNQDALKIRYTRFIPKDKDIMEITGRKFKFPLKKVSNFEKLTEEMYRLF